MKKENKWNGLCGIFFNDSVRVTLLDKKKDVRRNSQFYTDTMLMCRRLDSETLFNCQNYGSDLAPLNIARIPELLPSHRQIWHFTGI